MQNITKKDSTAVAYQPRVVSLSKVQVIVSSVIVALLMLVLIGCSVVSPPMYVTDEAEDNKVCPADYLDAILKADDEIQEEVLIPPMVITDINHPEYVAPAKCHSFYRNSDEVGEEPIWFGRVQNLQAEN